MIEYEGKRYYKLDSHFHTTASDGGYSVEQMLAFAKLAGLDMVILADHDTTEGAKKAREVDGVLLIPGCEYTTSQGHTIGVFPEGVHNRQIPMFLSFAATADIIQHFKGLVIVPHMGLAIEPGSTSPRTVRKYLQRDGKVHAMEGQHPFFAERHIAQAIKFAREHNIPMLGASDAHDNNIGRYFITLIPVETGDKITDLYLALENNTTKVVPSGLPLLKYPLIEKIKHHPKALAYGLDKKAQRFGILLAVFSRAKLENMMEAV